MEIIHLQQLNVQRRAPVARDDIVTHAELFKQDVVGLLKRDVNRFHDICHSRQIIGETTDELVAGLVQLFSQETHYKRRNKLRASVTNNPLTS